jgi:hypothetical protein
LSLAQISHAKPQRRKALPRFNSFLCVFAPLRGNLSLAKAISNTFSAKPRGTVELSTAAKEQEKDQDDRKNHERPRPNPKPSTAAVTSNDDTSRR